ncbi:MAG: aspartate-semialdehyde dehydrogenase [Candidatus Eisenbacteria bacterium]|uniref:Aspartate-semialdehyde dehydrogenase n=1 Tax=Eiseniibacteriota bacterium TaxID=2212470 RepID=A0A956RNI3_UNCEI|nr:aspartate-semialdehyde dehydrogenase [Candidatus Eisenbacteria bacterium]
MSAGWSVAILGATGAVGRTMLETLADSPIAVRELRLLATPRGAGRTMTFRGNEISVTAVTPESFAGVELALFSAGAAASETWAPIAVRAGAWVIDNSSRFRMDPEVALIVPEVNPHRIPDEPAIIANPNCSTIQMVVALAPLHARFGLAEVFVATYQSASGAGGKGLQALETELAGGAVEPGSYRFPRRLAGNVIPQCDVFLSDGYTREEEKMVHETQKILDLPELPVHPTCVRVPVPVAHSEAIYLRLGSAVNLESARIALQAAPGVRLLDDPGAGEYPTADLAAGTDPVWVGRLRADRYDPRGLHLWVVSDNLRKGAALNAVQIACLLWDRRSADLTRSLP